MFDKSLPVPGFEPGISAVEATALPLSHNHCARHLFLWATILVIRTLVIITLVKYLDTSYKDTTSNVIMTLVIMTIVIKILIIMILVIIMKARGRAC